MIETEYLTPKDLQDILKIGRNKAYKLCELSDFPCIRIGSSYRINKQKFEQWQLNHLGDTINLR
jgi:excisionase family DNA binding protein